MITPKYLADVLALYSVIGPGNHGVIEVRHDEWCLLLTQGGECNCEPDVSLGAIGDIQ